MASRTCCTTSNGRRGWQRSLDSQDFGFASNLMDSSDVAPADELFYKGQLLPLLQDQRTHLVQSLCSSSSSIVDEQEELLPLRASARLESFSFEPNPRLGDGALDFDSCKPEQDVESSPVDGFMHSLQKYADSPAFIKEREELQTCNLTADAGDCRIHASSMSSSAHRSGDYGVLSWDEVKELSSCIDLAMPSSKAGTGTGTDGLTDLRSLSFRSQNSGFWDSGTDKDVMDSSSSRDSNGSSQDSYPNHSQNCKALQAPFTDNLHCRPVLSFSVTNWKPGALKQDSHRKETISQNFSVTTDFTEELAKHTPEAELALLPWKHHTEDSNKGGRKQTNPRGRISSSSSAASDKSEVNTMNASRSASDDAGAKKLFSSQGRLMDSKDCSLSTGASADVNGGAKARNQKSIAARKRWQMYARRLKPLCEMKLWMGQFGMMDDCGKRAYYEVRHGTTIVLPSSRRASAADGQLLMQRSHQLSCANSAPTSSNGNSMSQQKQANPQPAKLLAVSSCPSTISSPNHSGVLEYLDSIPKIPNPLKPANSVKAHSKMPNIAMKSYPNACHASSGSIKGGIQCSGSSLDGCSNNYRSMSTMQELHSAVQSAIAHCKESNKNLVMDDLATAD